jgi:hypothetical protein
MPSGSMIIIAKEKNEMEKMLAFDCKYAEGVEKSTQKAVV